MAKETAMLSAKIDAEVLNAVRNIVYWQPGLTVNMYVENALRESINKEMDIQQRPSELKTGAKIR